MKAKGVRESEISFLSLFFWVNVMQLGYCSVEAFGKELSVDYLIDPIDFALVRCLAMCAASHILTHMYDLSYFRNGLFRRNRTMILANAFLGTITVALSNIATMLLPLTIWFVLVSVLPFSIAAFSYLLFGEKMGFVSLIASVLSFGAIVLLTIAEPAKDTSLD